MTFFQVIMLKNLVWLAARFQISRSQCYYSIFTFNDGKCMYFEYQIDLLFCFSFSVIRTLTFFQVIMFKNLVRHAVRSQISCSQFYNSLFTFDQRKYLFTLNIKIEILFFFRFSSFGQLHFFKLSCSKI